MQRKRAHSHQDNMDPRCNKLVSCISKKKKEKRKKLVSCDYMAGVFHGHYFFISIKLYHHSSQKKTKTLHQKKYFFGNENTLSS